jgi:uncharacterized Zn finger protein (UPF0148 family)
MQHATCPSCGAKVEFRSAASVMAVCAYCRATIVKDAESARDLGKMSEVVEDYSPIQIGTSGIFDGKGFTVIGRIQLRYTDGFWNEWSILLEDGSLAWLSDASGEYVVTAERPAAVPLLRFEALAPGRSVTLGPDVYIASDVRKARCTSGQGELPFNIGEGWQLRAADLHCGDLFLTLDYSDGDQPRLYTGKSVALGDLHCQLLRDPETIADMAGRIRGKVVPLDCPSCGGPVTFSPGFTGHLVCPHCHAEVDATGPVAAVAAAARKVAAISTSLALGTEMMFGDSRYTILGLMQRRDDSGASWTEYLLYAPIKGFFWLLDTDDGWMAAEIMRSWPAPAGTGRVRLGGSDFDWSVTYRATVVAAAGAFNWRVHVGDVVSVSEYKSGDRILAAETTDEERVWSLNRPVKWATLKRALGREAPGAAGRGVWRLAHYAAVALVALNAIPLILLPFTVVPLVVMGLAAIYLPLSVLPGRQGETE